MLSFFFYFLPLPINNEATFIVTILAVVISELSVWNGTFRIDVSPSELTAALETNYEQRAAALGVLLLVGCRVNAIPVRAQLSKEIVRLWCRGRYMDVRKGSVLRCGQWSRWLFLEINGCFFHLNVPFPYPITLMKG